MSCIISRQLILRCQDKNEWGQRGENEVWYCSKMISDDWLWVIAFRWTNLGQEECEATIDVLDLLNSQFAPIRPAQFLARDDFQQFHQPCSIREVREYVGNLKTIGELDDDDAKYACFLRESLIQCKASLDYFSRKANFKHNVIPVFWRRKIGAPRHTSKILDVCLGSGFFTGKCENVRREYANGKREWKRRVRSSASRHRFNRCLIWWETIKTQRGLRNGERKPRRRMGYSVFDLTALRCDKIGFHYLVVIFL